MSSIELELISVISNPKGGNRALSIRIPRRYENLSKIDRTSIEHLSKIYGSGVYLGCIWGGSGVDLRCIWVDLGGPGVDLVWILGSKIYRTSIEDLSKIYRKSIEDLSKIYRKSIEPYSHNLKSIPNPPLGSACTAPPVFSTTATNVS